MPNAAQYLGDLTDWAAKGRCALTCSAEPSDLALAPVSLSKGVLSVTPNGGGLEVTD